MKDKKMKKSLLSTALPIALIFLILFVVANFLDSGLEGTDDRAADLALRMNPDYRPWFESVWEPGDDRTEKLLFGLQAVTGVGLAAYFFIRLKAG
ncbi:energy-coupling factor ABC transporter substrate-binding protein [Thermosediminibacter oceani]|nr:energy-coupling factor ABC transporter substrate-binding protein [Thermosediminibacter oceani]